MAKTQPAPPAPAPAIEPRCACVAPRTDPVRKAWAAFITQHLWKVVLGIVLAIAMSSGNLPVQEVELRFEVTDGIGTTITLGSGRVPGDDWGRGKR